MSTPSQFRKKPVVVEAVQWDNTDAGLYEILAWIKRNGGKGAISDGYAAQGPDTLHIGTGPYETAQLLPGGWVVKDESGKFFPMKPEMFSAAYEANS